MNSRSYAVIGLGQFGMTVALTLADAGCDVLAIDDREENVQDIAEKVSYAVKADVKEPGILQSVGGPECGCGCDRSGREYGSQYYSRYAGEGAGSTFCNGESHECTSRQNPGEDRCR